MGLFFKKSINLGGGLKLNLSKSGIGFSFGVKGFRISKNSKGIYLNAGRNGVYMRKKLDKKIKNDVIEEISEEPKQTAYIYQTPEQEKFSNIFILIGLSTIIIFICLILFNHPLKGVLTLIIGFISIIIHVCKNPKQFKEFIKQGQEINNLQARNLKVEIKSQTCDPNSSEAIKKRNESKYKGYKYSYENYKNKE